MREALTFAYKGKQVRTIEQDGETWWVLKDVCDILGLGNSRMIFERLDEDEKGVSQIDTLGGRQKMQVINESGLYNVILRSDKPEAKPFRKWVTSEVLPSIRRTGNYISNPNQQSQTEAAILALAGQMGSLTGQMGRLTEMVMGLYAEKQPERQTKPEQITLAEAEGRELCSATELLERFQLEYSVVEFNKLLREQGYMEQRVFKRLREGGDLKVNVLTERGLPYGRNARHPRGIRKAQPQYYADSFLALYQQVTKE